jgi:hypothetical protein
VADDDRDIKPAIGLRVYFGEILGKHSEVFGELEEKDLEVLTDDETFIAKFNEYGCASGYNPLSYIDCPECGDTLEAPYNRCGCGWERDV